ncbi:MAG: hypothetical protein JSR86_22245 [Proteobacteria bacterium]|nr:hypothetical protein [Pseudomonadota bacterium]
MQVTREGAIAQVRLDRPDARNALNALMMRELTEIARLMRRRSDLQAVVLTKEAVNAQANANHYASSFMDRDQYLVTTKTGDFREGVGAFFEKRKPDFKGD